MGGEKVYTSDSKELQLMRMYVYAYPAGLFGAFIGRILRFRVREFAMIADRSANELKSVEVEANSVEPECEVFAQSHIERLWLNQYEQKCIKNRLRFNVLESDAYPRMDFDVTDDSRESVEGTLHLHGQSHLVKCTKSFHAEADELVVQCPVSLKQFGIKPYSMWLSLFTQADKVIVETHVPSNLVSIETSGK